MVIVAALVLSASQQLPAPQWIWAPGSSIPKHVYFRRDIELTKLPNKASLSITCDDAYVLYVNGQKLASHASWYTMQTVDLKPWLRIGKNVLAVDAQNYESEAGLLVKGAVGSSSISTDSLWKQNQDGPSGWNMPDYDDSNWLAPRVLGPVGIGPWGNPPNEQEELRKMRSLKAAKPIRIDQNAPKTFDPARSFVWSKADASLKGEFRQMPIKPVAGTEIIGKDIAKPGEYVFDFGRELAGWVEIKVEAKDKPDIQIQVGEASDSFFTPPTLSESRKGGYVFCLAPQGGYTGFRYARVLIKELKSPIRIVDVKAVYRLWPTNYIGSFSCSDKVLTDIWELGAYTLRLNLDPRCLGAVLRNERGDRYPWMGDNRVAHRTQYVCFGLYDFAKVDLDFFVKPGAKTIDLNGIPGYTLDWVIALYNYWLYSGDLAEVKKHLVDIETVIRQYDSTNTPQGWLFTDWEPELVNVSDKSVVAFHTRYVHAAHLAAKMAEAAGDAKKALEFQNAASRRVDYLKQRPDWPNKLPQHALVNAIFAGNTNSFPAELPETTITPYYTYYMLEALSQTGQDARALKALRAYYKGMLDLGATSAWEYFTLDWLKMVKPNTLPPDMSGAYVSLCHPWSSGATPWLTEHVLGVTPAEPGYRVCRIKPFFGGLSWAKGSVPTPRGIVSTSWKATKAGYEIQCSAPRSVRIQLVLPEGYRCRIAGKERTATAGKAIELDGGREHRVLAWFEK